MTALGEAEVPFERELIRNLLKSEIAAAKSQGKRLGDDRPTDGYRW
jgi:DNA invertase Pin-like site-specific DNA recombinase